MDFLRLGDATDHGDRVIAAASAMNYDGRPLARMGDGMTCGKHSNARPNRITDGDPTMTGDGVPFARHGRRVECGRQLIPSVI